MSLSVLSKRRGELMGICTLFILLCHFGFAKIDFPYIIGYVINLGNTGVDGFFLLSGFGIWFALNKGEKYNYLSFYKKRYSRLLLPFLIVCVPYFAYITVATKDSFARFLLEISTLSGFTGGEAFWFISVTIVLYAVTPLMSLFERKLSKNKWVAPLVFMIVFLIFPKYAEIF